LLQKSIKGTCVQKGKAFTLSIAFLCMATPVSASESLPAIAQVHDVMNSPAVDPIEPAIAGDSIHTDAAAPEGKENLNQVLAPSSEEGSADLASTLIPDTVQQSAPRSIAARIDISKSAAAESAAIAVVDNDAEKTQDCQPNETARWQETIDSQGNSHIATGVRFPIVAVSSLSSRTAKVGDRMEARLKADLKINGRLIAPKGAHVVGHVSSSYKARRLLVAEVSLHRAMRANGALGITFDAIVTENGELLPLVAKPARQARIIKNHNEGRVLGVNHNGEIAAPLSTQLKHQGEHLAIRGAAAVGGVFTMGAVPVLFGVLGAMNPSFAFMQPVGNNVSHRRLKGFGMGVLSGLPGGFVVADFFIRGVEAQVKPGDEFLVELHQNFTGEPSNSAEIVAGQQKTVKGEVLNKQKPQK
jgi:hypothetical protein